MSGATSIDRPLRGLLAGAAAVLLAGLLYQHWQIIRAPVPLDLYEGTMPLITGIIAEGHNPYARAFQPQAADVYPPLYNIMVAPLTLVFGNTFLLHRAVSAFFILLAVAMCAAAARRHSGRRDYAAAVAVLLYAALLFYATPVSSTNAPGEAAFLACLLLPWYRDFSNASLAVALVCGLLCFYTKQYFIIAMPILCLYCFLFVSMLRALVLGAAFAVLFVASLALVHLTSPYYLDDTLFAPAAAIHDLRNWEILAMQLVFFARVYIGLFLAMALALIWRLRSGGARRHRHHRAAGAAPARAIDRPALSRRVDFFWFCLACTTLVVVLWLGRNPGNWMTYLFQLMSPFLLLAGFGFIARSGVPLWAVLLCTLLNFYHAYSILHRDFSVDLANWAKMERVVADSNEVLASQMLVMLQLEQGKPVFQDGHTFYFPLARHKPALLVKSAQDERVEAVWNDYLTRLYRKIQRREFDAVLVSSWEMRGIFGRNPPPFEDVPGRDFLARYYVLDDRIRLSMTDRHGAGTYDVMVWRPRTD